MQATTITRALCRKHIGKAIPRAETFCDLKFTADHKVLSEGCDSRHNQRYAAVVQDLALQCFQAYPFWMKKSQETDRRSRNFLESWEKFKGMGYWQSLQRIILESFEVYTSSFRDKWQYWKSSTKSQRRYLGLVATIRIRWKKVGWFYGMLLLSAKRPRPLGGWENSPWKTIRRSMQKTNNFVRCNGRMSSDIDARSIKTVPIWKESFAGNTSWVCVDRGANLERRHSDPGHWGTGDNGRFRNPCSEAQCENKW